MVGMPAAFALATVSTGVLERLMNRLLKSIFPVSSPRGA